MEARSQEAQGGLGGRGALIGAVALAVAAAALTRGGLLWDDAWAPGYDGGYYVLQVTSTRAGAPIFADRSLVFDALAGLASLLGGDVVLANKVGALVCGAALAGLCALAAGRWTGRAEAAALAGLWVATAPGHLGISAEYLKNEGGLALIGGVLALLAAPRGRGDWLGAAALAGLAGLCHKVMGGLGLGLLVGAAWGQRGAPGLRRSWLAAGLLLPLVLTLVRPEDLLRSGEIAGGDRITVLMGGRLPSVQLAEVLLTHLCPLGLGLLLYLRPALRGLGLPLLGFALLCTAPGLPFGFDLTAWRLLLMGTIPLAFGLGAMGAGRPRLALALGLWMALVAPGSVASQAAREPDYEGWAPLLDVIRAAVPVEDRLIAHRGLCGYLWAAGGRRCENFAPQGDPVGWWRVVYGFGEERLFDPEAPPPLALRPGYTLITEAAWRRFVAASGGRYALTSDPRNPYEARPAYVYGPSAPP